VTAAPVDYQTIFQNVIEDSRYMGNIDWGEPRAGHPEGSIRAHIADLEANLEKFRKRISDEEWWKLRLLIHTHDTFKGPAAPGVSIVHPHSHASLARAFLTEYCDDADLLAMVQFHDEPFALYRQFEHKRHFDTARFEKLLKTIHDWDLFLLFNIIDGSTAGKSRDPLRWFFQRIEGRIQSRFTAADIL